MAMLARVAIPMVPATPRPKPRFYPEGSLPTKPSEQAPVNAKILSRDITNALYVVCLPDGEIVDDVAVENILDYVSAFELECYELAEFREAADALKAADAEEDRLAVEKEERRVMRKKMKGLIVQKHQESDESTDESSGSVQANDVAHGRHGRARPTYTHLYHPAEMKKAGNQMAPQGVRRRRKRDPVTGLLMPLSDHESDNERPRASSSAAVSSNDANPEKRRRRKRDPVTGELLPLSPREKSESVSVEPGKRSRRKRHPLTGELMPLDWKYDPSAPIEKKDTSSRRANGMAAMSPGMQRLSISAEPNAKRVKLDFSTSESSSSEDKVQGLGIKDVDMNNAVEQDSFSSENIPVQAGTVIRGEGESETDESVISVKAMPTLFTPRGMLASQGASSQATNPRPVEPGRNSLTAMMHSSPPRDLEDDDDDMDDDLADDEWFIEAILAHRLSDPLTHAAEYGAKPVMLYQVKWEGSDELTWEPLSSFPDPSIIDDYERRARMNPMPPKSPKKKDVLARRQMLSSSNPASQATQVIELDLDENVDEEQYQVEAITAHHLSDPRTHKAVHSRKPVMLYQVKWVGHEELTWETAKSFADPSFVNKYRKRVGLLPLSN